MVQPRHSPSTIFATVFLAALLTPGERAWAVPGTPTGFVAAPPTACGAIWLSWNTVAGVTGYHLYRDGTRITSLSQPANRYYDYEMAPGAHAYAIESYDPTGVSPQALGNSTLPAPAITVDSWDWFNDVFPTTAAIPGTAAFDRATAKPRTGHNLAPLTGDFTRAVTPGSNVIVHAPGALGVTLYYRIKPGPGNYKVIGMTGSGLLWDPAVPAGPVACPGDASYWGPHIGAPACPGIGVWDPNAWFTSACDALGGGDFQTTTGAVPIFPDDLFTPGTVIQYYFVASFAGGGTVSIPDPSCVMQVANQGSLDGHRWEQFTVLPDAWKRAAYGGLGTACVLVVDLEDGRGNERVWTGLADSIAATAPAARGLHNGWRAPGQDPVNVRNPVDLDSPAYFVAGPNGAAGTTWDLYTVRGWQSNTLGNAGALGGRLGVVPAGSFPPGPTPPMLDAYYRIIVLLAGDRDADILGPRVDRSQDDEDMIRNFLIGATAISHRGIWVNGNGFATSEAVHPFLLGLLSADLRNTSYPVLSGNATDCVGLIPTSVITTSGNVFGVRNAASPANDVLQPVGDGVPAAYYDPLGANPLNAPYVSAVFVDAEPPLNPDNHWQALLEGWNIRDLKASFCATSYGRLVYYYDVLTNVFGKICSILASPLATTDVAADPAPGPATRLLELRNNPLRDGTAEISFTLAERDRVEASIYDVAGRILRVIPAREFEAGSQRLSWDGTDAYGRRLQRGMYYVRVRFERTGVAGIRKVVVLE